MKNTRNEQERKRCKPGKKNEKYHKAEKLYILDGWAFTEIGNQLNISITSLRKWSKEGNWKAQRKGQLALTTSALSDTIKIVDKVGKMILTQLDEGVKPDASILNYHTRLLAGLTKVKEFDLEEKKDKPPSKNIEEDTKKAINRYFGK